LPQQLRNKLPQRFALLTLTLVQDPQNVVAKIDRDPHTLDDNRETLFANAARVGTGTTPASPVTENRPLGDLPA
jgi:hypothetical protein